MLSLLEKEHVQDVYDEIADHFSDTRYCIWDFVRNFVENKRELNGLDIGCGNGKNMGIFPEMKITGVDRCEKFVEICAKKGHSVMLADCCSLPFENNVFDYAISIAAFHHMATDERRNLAMSEMIRVLKPGGEGLVSVWAVENQNKEKIKRNFVPKDNFVKWLRRSDKKIFQRYYHIYTEEMMRVYLEQFTDQITISKLYNERGNWVVEFKKLI